MDDLLRAEETDDLFLVLFLIDFVDDFGGVKFLLPVKLVFTKISSLSVKLSLKIDYSEISYRFKLQ
jgi:hypothetical protein